MHPGQVPRVSRKTRGGGLAGFALGCRNYLAWHPILGGLGLSLTTAILITTIAALVPAIIPVVNGWPICTPLNGVALALLLPIRRRHWPWIVLGLIVALSQGGRLAPSIAHMSALAVFANLAEVCLAAFTLPPFRNLKQWLQEPRLVPAFFGYAMVLGPLLMSAANATRLSGATDFRSRLGTLTLAEALGIALATPLVLVLLNRETYALLGPRALPQTLGLFGLMVAAIWLTIPAASPIVLLAPTIVLLIIAFRLGLRAAILGIGGSAAAAFFATVHAHAAPATAQTFLAIVTIVVLPLSVVLTNKHFLEDRLDDANGELDKLRSLDRLTGVPNRKRFDLVLEREWQRALRDLKPVALIMVDVDNFDLFNQHYGPQAGDECLRRVAVRMAELPHRAYDLLSRYEGGRFTVLLPGASGEAVERIAEEFRAEIAAQEWPHQFSPFERVTVSVGWAAIIPSERSRPDALITAADIALRLAQENGKNRVEGVNANVAHLA